jgi:hypothetical protein
VNVWGVLFPGRKFRDFSPVLFSKPTTGRVTEVRGEKQEVAVWGQAVLCSAFAPFPATAGGQ